MTVLHRAVREGTLEDVRRILSDDSVEVDIDAVEEPEEGAEEEDEYEPYTALDIAAKLGSLDKAELLLQHRAKCSCHTMAVAAKQENLAMCRLLLTAIPPEDAILGVVHPGYNDFLREILETHGKPCPFVEICAPFLLLEHAAGRGFAKTCRLLIEYGWPLDSPSEFGYPLYYACFEGHTEVVRVLLDAGTDANRALDIEVDPTVRHAYCLHTAIVAGHVEVCRLLIAHGADVNALDWHHFPDGTCDFSHPLDAAVICGLDSIVELLLAHGADANAVWCRVAQADTLDMRMSPLETAAVWGTETMIVLLLAHGANALFVDDDGTTPLLSALRSMYKPDKSNAEKLQRMRCAKHIMGAMLQTRPSFGTMVQRGLIDVVLTIVQHQSTVVILSAITHDIPLCPARARPVLLSILLWEYLHRVPRLAGHERRGTHRRLAE